MIYKDNKYTTTYYKIIEKAIGRDNGDCYVELHHIIPEAFYEDRKRKGRKGWLSGNPDISTNLVNLTAREHFICHWLLIKMTEGNALNICMYALNGMKRDSDHQERYETKITSRVYARLKPLIAQIHSNTMKGRIPWNKGKKETRPEVLEKIKQAALDRPQQTAEMREKQAQKTRGQKRTDEFKKAQSERFMGIKKGPMSQEEKDKRSIALIGKKKREGHGKAISETVAKQKAEGTHYSQIKIQCPYCDVKSAKNKFTAYHGEKCKNAPTKKV